MRKRKVLGLVALLMMAVMIFAAMPVAAAEGTGVMSQLLQDVSPKGSSSVTVGQVVTLRALVRPDATVSAEVYGKVVAMSPTEEQENGACWYTGHYTVPALAEGTSLGDIRFTAKSGSASQSRIGGSLAIARKNITVIVDNPEMNVPPVTGDMVMVTPAYADIYSISERNEEYAAPYYYNLPKGTIDYVTGSTSASYNLKSGRRIAKANVTSLGSGTKGNNTISNIAAAQDGTFTTLTVSQSWKVPFNLTPTPVNYSNSTGNTVTSCNPDAVVLTFDYTTAFKPTKITFPAGSAFTNATWEVRQNGDIPQVRLTLTLAQKGGYYGAYASYNAAGDLVLQFLNPVNSLQGARIVVDPGHGTGDVGNAGSGYYESNLNLQKAKALKAELEARGATVYMLDTNSGKRLGVYDRVDLATAWQPHLYLSVHHNWADNTSARGIEVYYNTPNAQRLAQYINADIFTAYQGMSYGKTAKNRGAKFSEFAVNRTKQFASVLIEYGFLSNNDELSVCVDEGNNPAFARATADGVEQFFSGR